MDTQVERIISDIDQATFAAVVRGVLDDETTELVGEPDWTEIDAPHNDRRTIGIFRVVGAAETSGRNETWSCVVKLIDTSRAGGRAARWVNPEIEETVYEHGLFTNLGLGFRPARCYLVARPQQHLKMFWLEDLTDATGTPFSVDQLSRIARNLGEFNGAHLTEDVSLPFTPPRDSYVDRWNGAGFARRVARVIELADASYVRATFRDIPVESASELFSALDLAAKRSRSLNHSLCFGDCQPANVFLQDGQTIAIDWASVTIDPTGVDAGCLIGSGMTWGTRGAETVDAEREMFSEYVDGLMSRGFKGRRSDLRLAYFGQFGLYLMAVCTLFTFDSRDETESARFRGFLEARFKTPFDEIPDLVAPIVARYPSYVKEISKLIV